MFCAIIYVLLLFVGGGYSPNSVDLGGGGGGGFFLFFPILPFFFFVSSPFKSLISCCELQRGCGTIKLSLSMQLNSLLFCQKDASPNFRLFLSSQIVRYTRIIMVF